MSTPSTALTVQQQNQIALKSFFEGPKFREELKQALPEHIKPDRFVRVALTAINQNPKILNCAQQSIGLSMLKAAASGLDVGRECHLIPYGQDCQFQLDYKGLATMLRRSGVVADVHSDIVCEGDEFSYCYGTGSHLKHKPARRDRGQVTEVYSYVRFKDGSESFEVMSVDDVNYVRDTFSQGYKYAKSKNMDHPWISSWEAMACKTVFKKHSKWLPLSAEIVEAMANDEDDTRPGFDSARQVNERPAMPAAAKGVAAMRNAELPAAEAAKPAQPVDAPMTVGATPEEPPTEEPAPAPAPAPVQQAAAPAPAEQPAAAPAEPAKARRPRTPAKPATEQAPIDVHSTPVSTQTETTHATPAAAQPSPQPATEAAGGSAAPAAPAASAPKESTPEPEWPKTIVTKPVEVQDQWTKNTEIGYRTETRDGVKHGVFKKVEIRHPKFSGVAYYTGKESADKLHVDTEVTLTLKQQPPQPGKPPVTMIESIQANSELF